MNWIEYENRVLNYFKAKFNFDNFQKNAKIKGKLSNTLREIDILFKTQVGDLPIQIAIECKNWNSKLDVSDIGSFIDKLNDVGISKGVMISRKGYSDAARKRALSENDLQLFILDFENLNEFHGFWAIANSGDAGAFISAPSGWIIDANFSEEQMRKFGWQCIMYPMGTKIDEIPTWTENFGYFWISDKPDPIEKVFQSQNNKVLLKDPQCKIKLWTENLEIGKIHFREIHYFNDKYYELSAGSSTDRFHFYTVFNSLEEDDIHALARLRFVTNNCAFIVLNGVDRTNSNPHWKNLPKILKFMQEKNK